MTVFRGIDFVEAGCAVVEKVTDASKFRGTSKFRPLTLEAWHFSTFGEMFVKLFECFVLEKATVAGSQMSYFVQFSLDLIFESPSTVSAPVLGLNIRLFQ